MILNEIIYRLTGIVHSFEGLPEPAALAQMVELEAVMAELQGILGELGEEVEV
jgi:hypothetical protein